MRRLLLRRTVVARQGLPYDVGAIQAFRPHVNPIVDSGDEPEPLGLGSRLNTFLRTTLHALSGGFGIQLSSEGYPMEARESPFCFFAPASALRCPHTFPRAATPVGTRALPTRRR